nr:MAG TPA: hypothetical protein [Caudoviricetes sp.]
MKCPDAQFDRYFSECICRKSGKPCRLVCEKCKKQDNL